uniref:Uncharacterized protein n=1 Tax=Anguilla anguilla TaxID=7936 RepID=A0A0E9TRC9_ANGAN
MKDQHFFWVEATPLTSGKLYKR